MGIYLTSYIYSTDNKKELNFGFKDQITEKILKILKNKEIKSIDSEITKTNRLSDFILN
jgi:hypothetical protein